MKAAKKMKLLASYTKTLFPKNTVLGAVQVGDGAFAFGQGTPEDFLVCLVAACKAVKDTTGLPDEVLFRELLDMYFADKEGDDDDGGYDEAFDDPDEA